MPYLCQKNRFQAQPLLATRLLELILIWPSSRRCYLG
jgi:hypothetical protein